MSLFLGFKPIESEIYNILREKETNLGIWIENVHTSGCKTPKAAPNYGSLSDSIMCFTNNHFFCTRESCRHKRETNVQVDVLDVLEESLLQHRWIINFFKDFMMNTHLFLPVLREEKTVDMQDTGSRVLTNQLLRPDAVIHPNIKPFIVMCIKRNRKIDTPTSKILDELLSN